MDMSNNLFIEHTTVNDFPEFISMNELSLIFRFDLFSRFNLLETNSLINASSC